MLEGKIFVNEITTFILEGFALAVSRLEDPFSTSTRVIWVPSTYLFVREVIRFHS